MATKLSWNYQSDGEHAGEYHAEHNGYRVRAVLDTSPENPFTGWDCNWPISVRSPDTRTDGFTDYADDMSSEIRNPLGRFGDAALLFNQVHIAKALGFTHVGPMLAPIDEALADVRWCKDVDVLREAVNDALEQDTDSSVLETCAKLYALLDIPAYVGQTDGYSQGDWREVLVVAPPEYWRDKFGNDAAPEPEQLAYTVKLYGAWAWGDVYGYIVEKPVANPAHVLADEDADDEPEVIWEETDSCWGYYGSDFDESGLEDAALECVPDEEVTHA